MSKRKFGFEGFGISKKSSYEFEAQPAKPRLYLPSPPRNKRSDNVEDHDLDNIQYEDDERDSGNNVMNKATKHSRSSHGSQIDGGYSKEKGRRRAESWSGSDEEDDDNDKGGNAGGGAGGAEDDEVDPLDAFMEGIHEEVG
jgi:ATP-dependent RNA helicase DDX42